MRGPPAQRRRCYDVLIQLAIATCVVSRHSITERKPVKPAVGTTMNGSTQATHAQPATCLPLGLLYM